MSKIEQSYMVFLTLTTLEEVIVFLFASCAPSIKTDLKALNGKLQNLYGKRVEVMGTVVENHFPNIKDMKYFLWSFTLEKEGYRFPFEQDGDNFYTIRRALGLILQANKEGGEILVTGVVNKEGIDLKTVSFKGVMVYTDIEERRRIKWRRNYLY